MAELGGLVGFCKGLHILGLWRGLRRQRGIWVSEKRRIAGWGLGLRIVRVLGCRCLGF